MALDMSQFYQVFFEETAEHLANLESQLLEVDRENPDPELLNAIFRAAHSIKGSSGTFGFNDMMEVTHVLETLLDRIRKGELALTEEMVDVFLQARDVLGGLLAAHQGDGEADREAMAAVCERLQQLSGDAPESGGVTSAPVAPQSELPVPEPDSDGLVDYNLRFVPVADLPQTSMDSVLRELGVFGQLEVLERPLARGQPWSIRLATTAAPELLRDVIDFVADGDSIRIEQISQRSVGDDSGGAYGFFPDTQAAEETAYGFFEPQQNPVAVALSSGEPGREAWGLFEQPKPAQDEAYGFFGEVPAPPCVEDAKAPAGDPGGAYGFFNQQPGAVAAELGQDADSAIQPGDPKGAYGFFVPVPKPPVESSENNAANVPAGVPDVARAVGGGSSGVAATAAPDQEAAPPRAGTAGGSKAEKPKAGSKSAAPAKVMTDAGTIRVGVEKVDQMINLVGELVITQAMLTQAASRLDPVEHERLMNGLAQLERNTRDLQESVMSIRMLPISMVFSRFPRVVRDLSQKLGKQVELKLSGESTELDKTLIERISDPLTHLIRNSLDHGIEPTEVRLEKGKPPVGTITLSASHQSGNIVIEVGDDGAGLNREKILAKAKSRGLPVHDGISDQEVWQLIFEAGFSTADQVTEVSGRGVGMDVVKRNIAAMGGRVEIQSMLGVGTRMTVRLPLTLAILDGMSVAVGNENYIIPLNYVVESLQPKRSMVKTVSGVQRLIQVRGEYLPVVALHEAFHIPEYTEDIENAIMVVLEADGTKAALLVDALLGQHQVVIKSLEANYRKVHGISGATIMGDGHVALILDVAALVGMVRHHLQAAA